MGLRREGCQFAVFKLMIPPVSTEWALMREVTVAEPAILIRIAQLYEPGMSPDQLYEATRGVWKIGERRESVRYALAISQGIVREVYEIHCWHPAASTNYTTRPIRSVNVKGRWEFTGALVTVPP